MFIVLYEMDKKPMLGRRNFREMTVTLVFYEDPAKFRGAVLSEAKITIRSLAIP
jgi:hypothetical protein